MTVFVDDVRHPFRGMLMCHMWADSEPELIAMADRIGLARKHLQRTTWVHFDISKSKRALAVAAGAVETDRYGPAEHVARLAGDAERLERVRRSRAWRARELF